MVHKDDVTVTTAANADDDWIVHCSCGVQAQNYDDGYRMVLCGKCCTWQHTACAGVPEHKDPPKQYQCFRCHRTKRRTLSLKRTATEADEAWVDGDRDDINRKKFRVVVKNSAPKKKKGGTVRERLFRKLGVRARR